MVILFFISIFVLSIILYNFAYERGKTKNILWYQDRIDYETSRNNYWYKECQDITVKSQKEIDYLKDLLQKERQQNIDAKRYCGF